MTSLNKFLDADVIAFASNGIYSTVNMLFIRKGNMLGAKNFSFESASLTSSDALREFILQYYKKDGDIPEEIILSEPLSDEKTVEEYFNQVLEKKVNFIFAKQGVRKQLTDMALANATEHLDTAVDKIKHKDDMTVSACKTLKQILNLKNYPKRMECFDISNISGVDKVGSMVVFIDGEAERDSYRRFKIKTFEGADDYRAHKEMMSRRLERLITDPEKFSKPDLIIIDGGKGQLSAAKEIFDELGVSGIDLIALAEREEEVFTLRSSESIMLDKRDYALKTLQRIRDEAHRFAITYFRSLHSKRNLASILEEIEGVGKKKRIALMEKFGTIDKIMSASEEELAATEGIGPVLAKTIYEYFKEKLS